MKEPIIQTFGLTKKFRKVVAVDDLSLKVPGGIYGFLGPNGAGKSTTIKMLVGSLIPTKGRIEIFGHDISGHENMDIHKRIGYVPEHPTYFMRMTPERMLGYMGAIFRIPKSEIKSKIAELLRLVDLEEARNRTIEKFSAGMKQRIGIAQALINDPELLILDEITSNLDPLGRNEIVALLKDLRQQGKTIFVSTHILPEVQKMNADSIGILNKGKIVVEGNIDELNKSLGANLLRIAPNNEAFRSALSGHVKKIIEEGPSMLVETGDKEKVWQVLAETSLKSNIPVTEFQSSSLGIEDIFMKVITGQHNQEGEESA
ncbi:MAG: ATP-binding cassette domain-containing protein [Candidatus Hodarchaeota archaeon]